MEQGKIYNIQFGSHLACMIEVTDFGLQVKAAMDGWGNSIPLNDITVIEAIRKEGEGK